MSLGSTSFLNCVTYIYKKVSISHVSYKTNKLTLSKYLNWASFNKFFEIAMPNSFSSKNNPRRLIIETYCSTRHTMSFYFHASSVISSANFCLTFKIRYRPVIYTI